MATAPTTATISDAEKYIRIERVSWKQYELILTALARHTNTRITYFGGRLTFASSSRRHDWYEKVIGRLIESFAEGSGLGYEIGGHSTYRREEIKGGVEGDEVCYLGANAAVMRGPVDLDLANQPAPDLAVEVEVTHPADDSVEVWGKLGVPEVWRLDAGRETLWFGVRQADGSYRSASRSLAFPALEPEYVLSQLGLAARLGRSAWVRQLADWVANTLSPGREV